MTDSNIHKHKYKLFAVGAVGTFMATFDGSIVNVALPTIAESFNASVDLAAWVALSYSLTLVALIMLFGTWTESKGYAFAYKFGYSFFITGSLLCGLSTSIYMLIFSRIVQATGTAMFAAVGPGMVTTVFPENERGKGIGLIVMMVSAGFILGPVAGGLLLSAFSWNSIFLINIPIGIIGLIMASIYFKLLTSHEIERKMRWAGSLSISITLVTAMFALRLVKDYPVSDFRIIGLSVISLLSLLLFIKFESNKETALIGFDIFRNRQFTTSVAAALAAFASISGILLLVPFYLERVKHLEPKQVALYLLIIPILMFIFAPLSGRLSDKIGFRFLTSAGVIIMATGVYVLSTIELGSSTKLIAVSLGIVGTGIGFFSTPNSSALMGSVTAKQRAITSGILATTRNIGISVGVAVTTALFALFNQKYAYLDNYAATFVASFHSVILISVVFSLLALPFCIVRANKPRTADLGSSANK